MRRKKSKSQESKVPEMHLSHLVNHPLYDPHIADIINSYQNPFSRFIASDAFQNAILADRYDIITISKPMYVYDAPPYARPPDKSLYIRLAFKGYPMSAYDDMNFIDEQINQLFNDNKDYIKSIVIGDRDDMLVEFDFKFYCYKSPMFDIYYMIY